MKKYIIKIFSFFVLLSYANNFNAQNIELNNPSFEGTPKSGKLPEGWFNRGTKGYSLPDTQPDTTFRVSKAAKHGKTYLGMVTRADDSHEAVIQRLESPLIGGQCYQFTCYLARSESYLSATKGNSQKKQHTQPIKLQVLGANSYRGDSMILYQSPIIDHTNWKAYTIKLKPEQNYDYFILQAYYVTPVLFPYIGNVLVDDCSIIEWVSCDKRSRPLAKKNTKKKKKPKTPDKEEVVQNIPPKKPKIPPTPEPESTKDESVKTPTPIPPKIPEPSYPPSKPEPPTLPESLAQLEAASIVEGLVMQVKNINFAKTSTELTDSSMGSLNEIYDFLNRNPEIVVEIGGHTNLLGSFDYSMQLSQQRASSVVRYLIDKGIDKKRIAAKGYGQTLPLIEGISNTANQTNQRVEIKIISIGK